MTGVAYTEANRLRYVTQDQRANSDVRRMVSTLRIRQMQVYVVPKVRMNDQYKVAVNYPSRGRQTIHNFSSYLGPLNCQMFVALYDGTHLPTEFFTKRWGLRPTLVVRQRRWCPTYRTISYSHLFSMPTKAMERQAARAKRTGKRINDYLRGFVFVGSVSPDLISHADLIDLLIVGFLKLEILKVALQANDQYRLK